MKVNISLYGIDLVCRFERLVTDDFDPQSGHFTMLDKWALSDVEHMGHSITDLMDDKLLDHMEKEFNAKNA